MGKPVSTGDAEVDALVNDPENFDEFDPEQFPQEEQTEAPAKPRKGKAPAQMDSVEMAKAIGAAVAAEMRGTLSGLVETIQNQGPVPQVPFAKHSFKTPFNPSGAKQGSKERPKLARICYQNHTRLDPNRLTKREIELLNALKPGVYCGERIEVVQKVHNGSTVVDLIYSNKTREHQIDFIMNVGRTLQEILEAIVKESTVAA